MLRKLFYLIGTALLTVSCSNSKKPTDLSMLEFKYDKKTLTCSFSRLINTNLTEVVLPEEVEFEFDTYKVTGIYNGAVSMNDTIESLVMSNSITYVGAIYGCSKLSNIEFHLHCKL